MTLCEKPRKKELEPNDVIAVIAHVLEKAGVATTAVGKQLGFRVHGEGGGDWVVNLAKPGGSWSRPSDPEAVERCPAALYAERDAFSHLITDPESLETDLKSGFLAVEGERAAFARLGRLLSSSGGLVAQRARQTKSETIHNRRTKSWR